MTQKPEEKPARKPRPAPDEGAAYTAAVMREVERLRRGRKWSAARLAEEMAKVGVPWTRDTVTNLEGGRRKRIAVHEVLALAWVLRAGNPLDLIAPDADHWVQLLPKRRTSTAKVRAWFAGDTGLFQRAGAPGVTPEAIQEHLPVPQEIAEEWAQQLAARYDNDTLADPHGEG